MMSKGKIKKKGSGKKVYSIIGDGETEQWYLQMIRDSEGLEKITIKPELPQKKNFKKQSELVLASSKIYDKVIWIFDFDTILKEEKEKKNGSQSKIEEFKNIYNKLKKNPKIEILINSPCLEFWIYLHFKYTAAEQTDCSSSEKKIKKETELVDYSKTEKYFKNEKNNLYNKLKPYLQTALNNAAKLGDFDFDNPNKPTAEIYKLFNILGIKA